MIGFDSRSSIDSVSDMQRAAVYGRRIEQAYRRGDVEEVGPSLAEAVLKTLDLGFDLGSPEEDLRDDEGH